MQQLLQEKLKSYLSLLKQDEQNLNLLLEVSFLYSELDEIEQAQLYIDKASTINREACIVPQGLLHFKQRQLQEAIRFFLEALEHEDDASVRYNLGLCYYLNEEAPKAWEALSAIEDDEYLSVTRLLMARLLHQEGTLEEAIKLLEEHVPNYKEDSDVLGFLSLLYFDINEDETAKKLAQLTLQQDPDNYDAQVVDIMLRLASQETNLEEINHLLAINPEDSRLWFALGSTYMAQGDFPLAIEQYQKTLTIHPQFYDCYIALAWSQLLNDELNEAHETYQNAISLTEDIADGWGGLAIIYALNADLEKAKQLIAKANELDKECFLAEIAQTIYLNHANPEQAQQQLLSVLIDANLPVSKKLASIIEELM